MDPSSFEKVASAMERQSPEAAFRALFDALARSKDYHRLFDAMLVQARWELGLPLVEGRAGGQLTGAKRDKFEERVLDACREIGARWLGEGKLPDAYHYYQLIGETEPVRRALETAEPEDDAAAEAIIELAIGQGVHVAKGLSLILERYGICQAITACEGVLHQRGPVEDRKECIRLLIRALHAELVGRLAHEIGESENIVPEATSVTRLLEGRDWLFDDDNYHIDTSHLSAVVRMARLLDGGGELGLAIELCGYGSRLSPRYRYPEPAPFEDVYLSSAHYLRAVAGIDTETGLEHFRAKADKCDAEQGTYPLEVYVDLLAKTGRLEEAIAFAGRHLNGADANRLLCPSVTELCQSAGAFEQLARFARERGDPIGYVAGMLQQRGQRTKCEGVMSEYYYDLDDCPRHEIFAGVVIQPAWLEKLMTSLVTFEPNAIVAEHRHPHEQMGIVLSGRAEFTIGGETRTLGPGDLYRIPSNVTHKVVALAGPVRAFDVFAPPREEYK